MINNTEKWEVKCKILVEDIVINKDRTLAVRGDLVIYLDGLCYTKKIRVKKAEEQPTIIMGNTKPSLLTGSGESGGKSK